MITLSTHTLLEWQKRLALILVISVPLLISPATYDSYLLPKFAWVTIAAAIWLWMLAVQSSWKHCHRSAIDLPLAMMGTVFTVSVAVDYVSPIQIKALVVCGAFITLFYGFKYLWSRGLSEESICLTLLITAVMLSVYTLAQDYGWDFVPKSGGVRDWRAKVVATLGNPNFLGGYLGISLPLLIAYALRKNIPFWKYILISLSLFLVVACMTVTFCVGVTVGLIIASIAGLLMMALTRTLPAFCWFRGILLFILLVCANLWYTIDNPYNSHGGSLFLEAKSSPQWASGMGARNFIWQTTRIMIGENPTTGIGFGNYLTKSTHYQGINYQRYGTAHDRDYVMAVDQPHFQLLETASECGPLGVFALYWVFCIFLKLAFHKLRCGQNKWFAWGTFLGVMTAVGHSFSSFPFHLPASSMAIVLLASWMAAKPVLHHGTNFLVSAWKLILVSLFSLITIIFACLHVVSDVFLRAGFESESVTSIAQLQRSIAYNPHQFQNHFLLANRYTQLGWYDQAIVEYHASLQYQKDLKAHEYMARIYAIQQKWEAAIEQQKRVIELNPVFPGHYRDLITYLKQAGQEEEIPALEEKARMLEEEIKIKYAK